MNGWLFIVPVISAFIGWFANWIAIKMLFHPRQPKRLLGITFHGIFPKRQRQFAEKLAKLVSGELISFNDIEEKITISSNLESIMPMVEAHIDDFLRNKLGKAMPMIGMFIGEKTINELKGIFMNELKEIFPDVMKQYMNQLKHQLDLEKIVVEKVSAFSSDKLETVFYQIMSKEFRFVQLVGAGLGFLIGIIQVLITVLTIQPR
jgi:uncharacterized membrane protein YheB (UPF0754 family)